MTAPAFTLVIMFDGHHASDEDRARAEQAIYDAIRQLGGHDRASVAAILDNDEQIEIVNAAGQRALTEGWRNPNGAYVSGITLF